MLRLLRNKKTAKKIWIILAAIIVPAFALWGSGSLKSGKQETAYLAKIFGRKISVLEYTDALAAVRTQAIMQFGDKFSEIKNHLNLESQAWERLILLAEAKKRRLKARDEEVIRLIKNYPLFQKKGQFDNALYLEMLRYIFYTQPRVFEEQIRQDILLSKLYNQVTESISLANEEIKEAYRKENEQISIYYITAVYSDFTKDIAPLQEEAKEYFVKNSLRFKQPLSFNLEYAAFSEEDKDETAIEEKINKLTLRLNRGEDFIKAAKEFGLSVKETGLFAQTDPIPGIGWSPEILNLILKVSAGQFISPVHIDKNYYILRLKERKEPYVPEFEALKDKVKEALIKDKSRIIAKEKIEACLKKLKEDEQTEPQKINWDKTAKEYGLKSAFTDLFKYGSYIEGIGASDNFWMSAEGLKENEFSAIIDMPSGLYLIKLKSRVPADEEKLTKEKGEFSQKLLQQKRQEFFIKFLDELKRKAQSA